MRNLRNPQLERGEVRIEDIKLNHKCRDDMSTLLSGLQYLYSQEASRDRLFALLDEFILPGINKKVGRPGMDMWSILVMGVVKQGLGCDFDRLHELVNEHKTLRKFLGHPAISDKLYHYQTLVDNVNLLNPELLGKVNHLIVESGHTVVGKKFLASPCGGAVIRLSLKPMFVIPQTLACCRMRSSVCSAMQGAPPQNMRCRACASGRNCRNPSGICSTRFGKHDAPVERISRPI